MTHACCSSCRLRFTAAAAHIDACPACGEPPHRASAAEALGLRLVTMDELVEGLPAAGAVAIPVHDPELTHF